MDRNSNIRLSRDPVLMLNLFAAAVAGFSAFVIHMPDGQQAVLNAAAFGVANVIAALRVGDGQVAAIMGAMKALIALGLGFGLKLNEEQQTVIMTLVASVGMMWTRTQVVSKVPPVAVAPVPVRVVQNNI